MKSWLPSCGNALELPFLKGKEKSLQMMPFLIGQNPYLKKPRQATLRKYENALMKRYQVSYDGKKGPEFFFH